MKIARSGGVFLVIIVLLAGCAGSSASPTGSPSVGQVTFGQSFDPQTMTLSGRMTHIATGQPLALVAHLPRVMSTAGLSWRATRDGTFMGQGQLENLGHDVDTIGFTLGPFTVPGDWRYDIIDGGGNLLATGSITVS